MILCWFGHKWRDSSTDATFAVCIRCGEQRLRAHRPQVRRSVLGVPTFRPDSYEPVGGGSG